MALQEMLYRLDGRRRGGILMTDKMRTWTDDHHKGDKAENDDRHKDDQKDDWFKLNVLDKVREKERQKVLAEVDAVLDEYIDLNKKMPTVRKDWEGISKACTEQLNMLKEEIKSRLEGLK